MSYTSNRGAVQFTIAPVVRGKGTRQVFATAAAVELSLQMLISGGSKITKAAFLLAQRKKEEDTEDTELDVDGGFGWWIVSSLG